MSFAVKTAIRSFERFAEAIEANKELLSDLDAQIGDGDHGINMDRGAKRVLTKIADNSYDTLGDLYRDVAINFMDAVGGYAGPLWGALFMRLAQALAEEASVTVADLASAFTEALDSVVKLGNAEVGDKTMVDALAPAIEALSAHALEGDKTAWNAAVAAAEQGMISTDAMTARRGRAAWDPSATPGCRDAGAVSMYYFIDAMRIASTE